MSRMEVVIGAQPVTGIDDFGVEWTLTEFGGWGSPASSLAPVQKTRAPGGWGSPRQLTPRALSPGGLVEGSSMDDTRQALDRLAAAISLDETQVQVTEGSLTRYVNAQRQDELLETWLTDTLVEWSAGMVCLDPRKYGDSVSVATGLPASSGGMTWPATWPAAWNSSVISGVVTINNAGNAQAPCVIRIDGPCPDLTIRHDSSGKEIVFAAGYALAAGSFLVIDMEARSVLEQGTASRNQWITSRGWFSLDPGVNDIIFSASSYDPSARMTVTAAPTYL